MIATRAAIATVGHEGGRLANSLIPTTMETSPAIASTEDVRSQCCRSSTRSGGAMRKVPISARTTTGTLIRKTDPHQKTSSSAPPMIGPAAAPTTATAPHTAMARLRSRMSSKVTRMSARVAGIIDAAPTARKARAPINVPVEGA